MNKGIKTTINTLSVGDTFSFLSPRSVRFVVTKIENETIFYNRNGREYNCNYDNGNCIKYN